ncbi:RagB/SusD family nutrient uptake outer membrane protein [Dysgonomonas sp. BGC7]|uniref:RagB/SusD family nutrient uptake outer membrane protein n=1 Tax=Dysgonomonas sp. BGC7 TaxID=1658008 RepID=UPI000681ABC8|nr:RagB/SusD family nutrient uptake outer membrane protein [Dysgonomonas sp. BGC7]MBD8388578.1 RagB/SusD family nutrient uptake outer membrane protein [Dysgonomonas sp. BGC7]
MKKIFFTIVFAGLFILTSCDLDYFPNDKITSEGLEKDPSGALYATNGNYAMFKEQLEYRGVSYSGSTYVRHYFQMAEFIGDNVCLAGRTSDPLYEALTYKRSAELRNITYLWWCGYKIINGANSVIETVNDGVDAEIDHIKGENYFLRALVHFQLSTLWSKPYVLGRDNMGIILRTSANVSTTQRSTVGVVYDQIVDDLKNAIRLMEKGTRRGNAGYVSKEAAQGLLTRVYLYMDKNDEVIKLANDMLAGATPESKLEPTATFPTYFARALESSETLWAVAHTERESRGASSLASMYLTDGVGWGEIYSSDPLNDLYGRYSADVRNQFVKPQYSSTDKHVVRWAIANDDDFYENDVREVSLDTDNNKYFFTDAGTKIYVETEMINGYPLNYISYKGEKHRARVTLQMYDRYGWPKYYVTKFSYQGGDPMLSSPVMLRWAEVILNRAEAYAKEGETDKALDDVNVIRKRAGLSGNELFSKTNMLGYTNVLDIVLDERRLELSFEGHRAFDVYRNKRSLDRRYSGAQPWETIEYTNNKIQYLIPQDEISVSGIPQNP